MWTADDFPLAAQRIVCMIDKGWFDDAVGRIEGSKIFAELMMSGNFVRCLADSDLAIDHILV